MRTYSHALLTWVAASRLTPFEPHFAAWGAALPDIPAVAGAVWLLARRKGMFSREELHGEACSRGRFRVPDVALHSALPVVAALAVYEGAGLKKHDPRGRMLSLLLGWAGHVLADVLTHAEDARPVFWPLSRWRLQSPVSYWDRDRHARLFTLLEHAAIAWALGCRRGAR